MSYQSLLQQHADQLTNHINAADAIQQVAASQKAQGLAEKYNEIQEHYNAAVGGISTLSGAFHKGRKVYKGLQTELSKKAAKAQPSAPTTEDTPTSTATTTGSNLANPTAAGEPLAKAPPVPPRPAGRPGAPDPAEAPPVPPRPAGRPGGEPLAEADPAANTNYNRLGKFPNLVNRGARQAPFQRKTAIQQGDSDAADLRETPLTDAQMTRYSATSRFVSTPADRLEEPEAGSALHAQPENSKLFSARNKPAEDDFASTNPQDFGQSAPRSLGSSFTPRNAESTASSAPTVPPRPAGRPGAPDPAEAPPAAPAATAGEEGANVAKTAAATAGEEGGEVAGLSALDAIPVVGELVGAGLGLYSLFHGLSSEPNDASEELTKTATPSEGVAIDPSAVEGKT